MKFIIELMIIWAILSTIVLTVSSLWGFIVKKFKERYFMITLQADDGFICTIYTRLTNGYPDKISIVEWMYSNWNMGDTLPSQLVVTNIIELPNKKAYDLISADIDDQDILGYKPILSDEEQMAKDLVDAHEEHLINYVQNKNEKPN